MRTTNEVKRKVKDHKPQIYDNALKIADTHTVPAEVIARQMKQLFNHEFITEESIELYNRLERRWKVLTNYKVNENRAVSWE